MPLCGKCTSIDIRASGPGGVVEESIYMSAERVYVRVGVLRAGPRSHCLYGTGLNLFLNLSVLGSAWLTARRTIGRHILICVST